MISSDGHYSAFIGLPAGADSVQALLGSRLSERITEMCKAGQGRLPKGDVFMGSSASATSLVGTWRLSSREDVTSDGQRRTEPTLGHNPVAYLMYDAAGHFAVQFMRRDRGSARGNAERPPVGVANNSDANNGYDAYFGRYEVGADFTVTQELEGALSPADVGKVLTRRFHINDTELTIVLETTTSDGQPVTRTLRWQRVSFGDRSI